MTLAGANLTRAGFKFEVCATEPERTCISKILHIALQIRKGSLPTPIEKVNIVFVLTIGYGKDIQIWEDDMIDSYFHPHPVYCPTKYSS